MTRSLVVLLLGGAFALAGLGMQVALMQVRVCPPWGCSPDMPWALVFGLVIALACFFIATSGVLDDR